MKGDAESWGASQPGPSFTAKHSHGKAQLHFLLRLWALAHARSDAQYGC